MTDMTIATTIREQLGRQACFMMGAKDFLGDSNSLTFRIGRNAGGWSHIKITFSPDDTYEVTFMRFRKLVCVKRSVPMVYADQLRAIIEQNTQLYLSMGTMGRVA